MQIGIWHVVMEPDNTSAFVKDSAKNVIAHICASTDRKVLARAGLIASAPALLDAVMGALEVFRAIAEHAEEPSSLAAQDIIPVLESALSAASILGPITDNLLEDA